MSNQLKKQNKVKSTSVLD
jgi:hypothetical protein